MPAPNVAAMVTPLSSGDAPESGPPTGFVPRKCEDIFARQLLRPLFGPDMEILLLAGFDRFERLITLQQIGEGHRGRCSIPPQTWRALLQDGVASVLIAHNHPSGAPSPSDADKRCTQNAAAFLRTMDIALSDHLIFVDSGHFSFREAGLM